MRLIFLVLAFLALVAGTLLAGTASIAAAQLEWSWTGPQVLTDAVVAVAPKGADIRQPGQVRLNAVHSAPGAQAAAIAGLLAGLPDGEYTLFVRVVADDGQSSPWSAPLAIQVLGGKVTDAVGTLQAAPSAPEGLKIK